jgi:hypothetical protein
MQTAEQHEKAAKLLRARGARCLYDLEGRAA